MDVENLVSQILKLFYLASFFQGLILIVALFKKGILKLLANRILLILLITISIILLFFVSWLTEIISIPRELSPLAMLSWFCVGPLFYLYIQALFNGSFKLYRLHIIYFVFPIYHLIETTTNWLGIPFGLHFFFEDFRTRSLVLDIFYLIHSLTFCILTIRFLVGKSDKRAIFMRRFFYVFSVAMACFCVNGILYSYGKSYGFLIQLLILCFAVFVHYSAISSIRSSAHLKSNGRKYKNVTLNTHDFNYLEQKLKDLMLQKKVFLNADLKLLELANELNVSENTLSNLLNEHLKMGFYEYLRYFRLLEFENRIKQPEYKYQKITAVAKDSGFKSRTTFYQAFKEKHGISPSIYIKNQNNVD